MSMSNVLSPGRVRAVERHVDPGHVSLAKPSLAATALATALSKPRPLVGSPSSHGSVAASPVGRDVEVRGIGRVVGAERELARRSLSARLAGGAGVRRRGRRLGGRGGRRLRGRRRGGDRWGRATATRRRPEQAAARTATRARAVAPVIVRMGGDLSSWVSRPKCTRGHVVGRGRRRRARAPKRPKRRREEVGVASGGRRWWQEEGHRRRSVCSVVGTAPRCGEATLRPMVPVDDPPAVPWLPGTLGRVSRRCGGRIRPGARGSTLARLARAGADDRAADPGAGPGRPCGRRRSALVLLGYRPGGPVDILVGHAAVGPVLVALAAVAVAARGPGDRAFAGIAWLALAGDPAARPVPRGPRRPAHGQRPPDPAARRSRPRTRGCSPSSQPGCSPGWGSPGGASARRPCGDAGSCWAPPSRPRWCSRAGTAFAAAAVANELALGDRPAIASRFGPDRPGPGAPRLLRPPRRRGTTARLELRMDGSIDSRYAGQVVIEGIRDGADVSWTGFAATRLALGQQGLTRVGGRTSGRCARPARGRRSPPPAAPDTTSTASSWPSR